ncbi:nuclear transport factor 2 family protein [Methanosarcina siciliae]|nr:nuclear transport factor 2 family protein [Methanosarcina siciliae]
MTILLLSRFRIAIKRAKHLFTVYLTVYLTFDPMIATTTDIMAAQTQSNRKNKMMAQTQSDEGKNKEIINEGFAKWASGAGDVFDLLTDDMEWTIIGSSPVSKTYTNRKQFLEEVITPLNERLSVKIVPRVRGIYADGDMVIALWDGTATAKDGKPYNNTYSWYMTMKNGRIVKVVAFFDTIALADLWKRIPVSKQDNK